METVGSEKTVPEWSGPLRNLYWLLRFLRQHDLAKRRKLYRRIAADKKRLIEPGVDLEEVRRLCRWLSNPANQAAEARFRVRTTK